ncbi:MAG: energy transducer TonB [Bacteriovoracaceae bacterium]|nr:energy transducer TonB [Bacteriovoracaceae bacterium]
MQQLTITQQFLGLMNSRESKILRLAILLTLLLHFSILFFKVGTAIHNHITQQDEEQVIKIKLNNMPQVKSQIVETIKTSQDAEPQDSRFLSEKNNKAQRQTVAKVVDKFNVGGKGIETAKEEVDSQATQSKNKEKNKEKEISLKDLRVKNALAALNEFQKPTPASARKGSKTANNKNKGLSSSNDFIEDIPLGDFTILNTTEYKFYGFYHRIKQKLEQFWGQSIQEKVSNIYKSGRRLPAGENHMTGLIIKLNSQGQIIAVKIKNTSGVRELDDAAVDSFNKAGPFPNPPKEMVKSGFAVIEWGFVVKT